MNIFTVNTDFQVRLLRAEQGLRMGQDEMICATWNTITTTLSSLMIWKTYFYLCDGWWFA